MSIQSKIFLTVVVWLALCGGMFLYGFKVLDGSNRAALADISKQKNQMLSLQAAAESYRLSQKDVQDMAKNNPQPIDFFSSDVTLVKEIETIENLAVARHVVLTLGGIGG